MKSSAGVVDDVVRSQARDQVRVGATAHGGDLGARVLGELHGHRTDRPGGAVDQHLLAGGELGPLEEVESRRTTEAQRDGVGVAEGVGDRGDRSLLGHGDVLGVAAEVEVARGDHPVTRLEPGDLRAHRLDPAGDVEAEDGLLRLGEAELQAHRQAHAARDAQRAQPGVTGVDRRRGGPDQHLAGRRYRLRHLPDPHDLRRPVPLAHRCLHEAPTPRMAER